MQSEKEAAGAQGNGEARKFTGSNLIDFSKRKIDFSVNLIGNRWLSKRVGGFVVAPSGHGKSSLCVQMAMCWACGRACCAIQPARPLRIVIIQAEDDDNDTAEMASMAERLSLTEHERDLIRVNTHLEWLNDVSSEPGLVTKLPYGTFRPVVDELLSQFKPDLMMLNPYTAYQTEDIQDNAANSRFLRHSLNWLMNKHDCGVICFHHTGKTQFQDKTKFDWYDFMYDMAGGAILTNWARSVLLLAPTIPGTYRFVMAKRFEKSGWKEREYFFSHSTDQDDRPLWVPSSKEQILGAKAKSAVEPSCLLLLLSLTEPMTQDTLIVKAKDKFKLGRDRVKAFLRILLAENRVTEHETPNKHGKPSLSYTKNPGPP